MTRAVDLEVEEERIKRRSAEDRVDKLRAQLEDLASTHDAANSKDVNRDTFIEVSNQLQEAILEAREHFCCCNIQRYLGSKWMVISFSEG